MNQMTVRAVLRLVAIVTILVGVIMATMTLVALVGTTRAIQSAMENTTSDIGSMTTAFGFYAVLSNAVIIGAGFLLWLLSPMLAEKVVE